MSGIELSNTPGNIVGDQYDMSNQWFFKNASLPSVEMNLPYMKWGVANPAFKYAPGLDIALTSKLTLRNTIQLTAQNPTTADAQLALLNKYGRVPYNFQNEGAPNFVANFDLGLIIDEKHYVFPDVWWIHYDQGGLTHPHGDGMYSNWQQYQPLGNGAYSVGKSIEMVAYKAGDPKQPCVFKVTVEAFNYLGGDAYQYNFEYLRDIYNGSPYDFVDEFNWKLALKRAATNWTYNIHDLSTTPLVHDTLGDGYLVLRRDKMSMVGESITVDPKATCQNVQKDYVSTHTLTNKMAAPVAMKCSDFAHQYADTTTLTEAWADKGSVSINIKRSSKVKVGEGATGAEISWETGVTFAYEHSYTKTETTTHTDQRTFTVSGQTVTVPSGKQVTVMQEWNRANLWGKATAFLMVDSDSLVVDLYRKNNYNASANSPIASGSLDIARAAKDLGLTTVRGSDNNPLGTFLWGSFDWSADIGVVGNISLSEGDIPVPPKPTPDPKPAPDPDPTPTPDKAPTIDKVSPNGQNATVTVTGTAQLTGVLIDGAAPAGVQTVITPNDTGWTVSLYGLTYATHTVALKYRDAKGVEQTTPATSFTIKRVI